MKMWQPDAIIILCGMSVCMLVKYQSDQCKNLLIPPDTNATIYEIINISNTTFGYSITADQCSHPALTCPHGSYAIFFCCMAHGALLIIYLTMYMILIVVLH